MAGKIGHNLNVRALHLIFSQTPPWVLDQVDRKYAEVNVTPWSPLKVKDSLLQRKKSQVLRNYGALTTHAPIRLSKNQVMTKTLFMLARGVIFLINRR